MTNNGIQEKSFVDDSVLDRSVQSPPDFQTIPGSDTFVINISSFADDLSAWGTHIRKRDRQLREFWPTEPVIAGAIQTIVASRTNMSWTLDGPPRTVGILQRMFQSSNLGKGWLDFQIKVCTDLLTQDNGAFVEIIRQEDKPNSPVLNLAHLDAWQCIRTGMPDTPVIYYDRDGVEHKLKWYQVLTFEDMPSPIERMNGLQVCFLSRILRAAQIIKDFGIFKREKIAGRNPGVIHLVSGVQSKLVEDKLQDSQHSADNEGYTRFMLPLVIGSLDPNATVAATTIDLRNVPDGFDEDTTLRWYIVQIAMAAGADFQDFAPITSGALGSGQQSSVLDRKSKGKGQETWRKLWEHKLNFCGILPQSVTFSFDEKDIQMDQEEADLNKTRAETLDIYYDKGMGILPLDVIHQMMADVGILKPEYLALLETQDVTTDIVAADDERSPTQAEIEDASGQNVDVAEVEPEEIPAEIRATPIQGSARSFWPFNKEETKETVQINTLKKKQIDTSEFQDILADLMVDVANGTISRSEFITEAESLVAADIINAYLDGSEKTIAQLTDEDRSIIDEQTEINLDAIPNLYDTSVEFGDNEEIPLDQLVSNRVKLWGSSVSAVFMLGFLHMLDQLAPVGWKLGPTDHCDTCLDASVLVLTRGQWRELGIHPKGRMLNCKGYRCQCEFEETDEPLTGL